MLLIYDIRDFSTCRLQHQHLPRCRSRISASNTRCRQLGGGRRYPCVTPGHAQRALDHVGFQTLSISRYGATHHGPSRCGRAGSRWDSAELRHPQEAACHHSRSTRRRSFRRRERVTITDNRLGAPRNTVAEPRHWHHRQGRVDYSAPSAPRCGLFDRAVGSRSFSHSFWLAYSQWAPSS